MIDPSYVRSLWKLFSRTIIYSSSLFSYRSTYCCGDIAGYINKNDGATYPYYQKVDIST